MKANIESSGAGRQTADSTTRTPSTRRRPEISASDQFNPSTLYQHRPVLWAYAIKRLRDRMLADDVVQETFLAALSGAGQRFNGASSIRTWLIAILKHKIVDALRERAKAPLPFNASPCTDHEQRVWRETDEPPALPYCKSAVCLTREPDAVLAFARFLEACQQRLDELPLQAARVFVLSEVFGHAAEEVSTMLGISTANVWVTRHRTRKSLQRSLESARPT